MEAIFYLFLAWLFWPVIKSMTKKYDPPKKRRRKKKLF